MSRKWWYALGVFLALGNFVMAVVALIQRDLFLCLVGVCVGIFVGKPLFDIWREGRLREDN
jgi:hypothetical protein